MRCYAALTTVTLIKDAPFDREGKTGPVNFTHTRPDTGGRPITE